MTFVIDEQTPEGVLLDTMMRNRQEVVCFYLGVVLTFLLRIGSPVLAGPACR